MSDKFEALSQPVGYISSEGIGALNRGASAVIFLRNDFKESPIYSQEYVTALLAALEEKDQRIAELEQQVSGKEWMLSEAVSALKAAEEQIEQLKGAK